MGLGKLDLSAVQNATRLVEVAPLRQYERPDQSRVAALVVSLEQTQTLVNPIIVDPSRNLVIDGHHRAQAFRWLGLERIPAYTVDYLSSAVGIRGWSWTTNTQAQMVQRAFGLSGDTQTGAWTVKARNAEDELIAERRFSSPSSCARHLEHSRLYLLAAGFDVSLTPPLEPLARNRIAKYMSPTIGKHEILAAMRAGELYPYEVNRHLIDGRPLDMHVPIDSVSDASSFAHFLNGLFEQGRAIVRAPGSWHDGRFYEERSVHFATQLAAARD